MTIPRNSNLESWELKNLRNLLAGSFSGRSLAKSRSHRTNVPSECEIIVISFPRDDYLQSPEIDLKFACEFLNPYQY